MWHFQPHSTDMVLEPDPVPNFVLECLVWIRNRLFRDHDPFKHVGFLGYPTTTYELGECGTVYFSTLKGCKLETRNVSTLYMG